jgi:hypothetical protein
VDLGNGGVPTIILRTTRFCQFLNKNPAGKIHQRAGRNKRLFTLAPPGKFHKKSKRSFIAKASYNRM